MLVKCPVCGARILNGRCEYCGFEDNPNPQPQTPPQSSAQNYQQPIHPHVNPALQQPFAPNQAGGYPPQPYPQTPQQAQPQVVIVNQSVPNVNVMPGVSRKSKLVALLLCLFLGPFGAHKFYVGKIGTGILYLFTVGFFGIGWIIDFFVILAGGFRDEFDLPLRD